MTRIQLGPFELMTPIGQGGMGEVWRGYHRGQDLPVAVKVVTAVQAREPGFVAAFRNEVQAVAGLDHPGIVLVFDHGEVSGEAARASGGHLQAGSPYLVMELLTGGRLDKLPPPADWPALMELLRTLLEALAHAHARGVVHRDLKLGNVLRGGPEDVRPGYRIIDFGLATTGLQRGGTPASLSAGTPAFEAPEQILGLWRDQGPWTDLYALGCMAFALAAGDPPFTGDNFERIHRCQLMVPMPPLKNRIAVARGFEGWLARLLSKHPSDRFRSAAEALHGLESLPSRLDRPSAIRPPVASAVGPSGGPSPPPSSLGPVTQPTRRTPVVGGRPDELLRPSLSAAVDTEEPMAIRHPPLPADWREGAAPARPSPRLVGAGLGLYGLRAVPLIDRTSEREVLWSRLRLVRREGVARALVLRGPAGTGKSRLAEWLAQRSHELAGGVTLRAVHSRIEGPPDGLPRMVARHLVSVGLSRARTLERVEKQLREQGVADAYEWSALTELIRPASRADLADGVRPVLFRHPTARYALIRRLIRREARVRPVIVWLDDVQWGFDALVFAKQLLLDQSRHATPVLLVLTAQSESLSEEPRNARVVDEILQLPRAEAIEVGPLGPSARAELVSALLSLEGELADRVAERTGGNPMFAVQLLGDWVERGLLEAGESGFVLRSGEPIPLPDTLHEVWHARLERLLNGHSERARQTLELAAALGRDVDEEELRGVALEAGAALDRPLLQSLFASRLARPNPGGWSFVHGMLRESIEREARAAGRWRELNRHCAEMLEQRHEAATPGIADRVGRHRLEAGEPELAVTPLLTGAREHYDRSEFLSALSLLDIREEALGSLGVAEDERAWGEGWVLRARVHVLQGQLDRAERWARRAERAARAAGWRGVLANALRSLAYGLQQKGDLAGAEALYHQARTEFESLGAIEGVAACLHGLGEAARLRGETERAEELNLHALDLFEEAGDDIGAAKCLRGLGVITQHRNDFAGAVALYERALSQYREVGNPYGVAVCINDLAEVKRWQGDIEGAEERYRRALDIYDAIGSLDGVITQINLGLVLMARGHWEEARSRLAEGAEVLERVGRKGFLGGVHAALLACTARAGDWESMDYHLAEANRLLESTAMVDADIAWPAKLAGNLATDAGMLGRASAAYRIALDQYCGLGDEEATADVAMRLAAIGQPTAEA